MTDSSVCCVGWVGTAAEREVETTVATSGGFVEALFNSKQPKPASISSTHLDVYIGNVKCGWLLGHFGEGEGVKCHQNENQTFSLSRTARFGPLAEILSSVAQMQPWTRSIPPKRKRSFAICFILFFCGELNDRNSPTRVWVYDCSVGLACVAVGLVIYSRLKRP